MEDTDYFLFHFLGASNYSGYAKGEAINKLFYIDTTSSMYYYYNY